MKINMYVVSLIWRDATFNIKLLVYKINKCEKKKEKKQSIKHTHQGNFQSEYGALTFYVMTPQEF